jgi:hypothetical protein
MKEKIFEKIKVFGEGLSPEYWFVKRWSQGAGVGLFGEINPPSTL